MVSKAGLVKIDKKRLEPWDNYEIENVEYKKVRQKIYVNHHMVNDQPDLNRE